MMNDGLEIYYFAAIALIVGLLATRRAKRLKSLLASVGFKKTHSSDRMFENLRVPAFKKCPNCAAELPLSALICDACDFNFLAGSLYRGNQLLPAPDSLDDQPSNREIAAAGL